MGSEKQLYQKYKAMRDTAIDIGKWIKGGKNQFNGVDRVTSYDTPFLE